MFSFFPPNLSKEGKAVSVYSDQSRNAFGGLKSMSPARSSVNFYTNGL